MIMIDTIVIRLHGANQQKTSNLDKIASENLNTSIQKVPEHFDLYSKLLQYKGKSFSLVKTYNKELHSNTTLNDEEFLSSHTSNVVNEHYLSLNKQKFIYADHEKEHNLNVRGKYSLTSQSYDVIFKININAGYIEFSFSIPKYLFGHQLAQFIPQINSKEFLKSTYKNHSFDYQSKLLFNRLTLFIDHFFNDLCNKFKVDMLPNHEYIEIFRLDFCYNQYFENKKLALLYLDEQKKIHKKKSFKKSKVLSEDSTTKNFQTSLTIGRSSGNYFKIYHKGSEYTSKNGDYSKHQKLNEYHWSAMRSITDNNKLDKHFKFVKNYFDKKSELGKEDRKDTSFTQFFSTKDINLKKERQDVANFLNKTMYINTPFFKDESDKILRYELSLSGQYLSTVYKHKIFRNNCSIHNKYKSIYKKVKKIDARKESYKYQVSEFEQKIFNSFHKFYNRKIGILLKVPTNVNRYITKGRYSVNEYSKTYTFKKPYAVYNKGTLLETKDIGLFQYDFLKLLCDEFFKVIKEFQINELVPYDTLLTKIKRHNEIVKQNLEIYNNIHAYQTKNIDGSFIIKGNKVITKASQLLTDNQKIEKKLKSINPIMIMEFYRLMIEDKLTISQVKEKLNLDKYAFHRRKKILNLFNISENSINVTIPIKPKIDFSQYYFNSQIFNYKKSLFINPNHSQIDFYFNKFQFDSTYSPNILKHEFRKTI
jgi:hypothetical protein